MALAITIAIVSILGVILLIGAIWTDDFFMKILLVFFGVFLITIAMYALGLDNGRKESLKGNNPYKMEIRYELQDSIYIPKDTVFTKIEK